MSLVISVSKVSVEKTPDLNLYISQLCDGVMDKGATLIYIPSGGKLIELIKLLTRYEIKYELKRMLEIDPE